MDNTEFSLSSMEFVRCQHCRRRRGPRTSELSRTGHQTMCVRWIRRLRDVHCVLVRRLHGDLLASGAAGGTRVRYGATRQDESERGERTRDNKSPTPDIRSPSPNIRGPTSDITRFRPRYRACEIDKKGLYDNHDIGGAGPVL